jgi:hypothetical protein
MAAQADAVALLSNCVTNTWAATILSQWQHSYLRIHRRSHG